MQTTEDHMRRAAPPTGEQQRRDGRRLIAAGYLFMVGSAIHIFDHLRRGQNSVTDALYAAGTAGVVVQATVITLILTRHRLAPLVSAAAGFSLALGFTAAHWLPKWSSLSDSFIDHRPAVFSIIASLTEIAGALAVGVCGLLVYWRATGAVNGDINDIG
jgi:hypothetical protein